MMGKTNSVTRKALTWDATATANSLLYGHTAYGADGTKLTGTGANWQRVTIMRATFMGNTTLPATLELYCPTTLPAATYAFGATFYGCTSLVTVNFINSSIRASDFTQTFWGCTSLQTVNVDIDFTDCTTCGQMFLNASALVTVRFLPSTIKVVLSLSSSPLLSTTSLLSIANGLHAPSAPKTLTMHATSKTNMNNINVDNVDGVAVLGNAMTLMEFITDIKGWTVV